MRARRQVERALEARSAFEANQLRERLALEANQLRQKAKLMPAGAESNELLKRASRLDVLGNWLSSFELKPPAYE
jgi:hypothetical protein